VRRGRELARTLAVALACAATLAGCGRDAPATAVPDGDPEAGRALVAAYQCGVCHTIPGIRAARGVVGPPLTRFALRSYIGGVVPNTPQNLVAWVMEPSALAPGTAMPSVGLDEQQARDVAAYLYQLR
jgi:cytochrome c